MREHAGPGDARGPVRHGVEDLVTPRGQEDPSDHRALQRPAARPPGERAQVQARAGAGGHEEARGRPRQGDLPVPYLQTQPGVEGIENI